LNRTVVFLVPKALAIGLLASASSAQTLTTLHSFTPVDPFFANQDGAYPSSSLVLSQNTLYGTASQGGDAGRGTVYRIKIDGTGFSSIYAFSGTDPNSGVNSDGAFPQAGLVLDGATLYGTASSGGAAANGTVFKVNTNGSGFVTLHSFSASDPSTGANTDGAAPWANLIVSSNILYGTTTRGGASNSGTVFKLNTNGTGFITLHSFSALDQASQTNNEGAYPLGGLILSSNTLYGTTYRGGSTGTGTVFKINTDGSAFTVLHDNDGGSRASLLLVSNALYGTTESGGSLGGGTIFRMGTDGSGFTNLQNFATTSGNGPWGGLALFSNVFYGATYSAGALALGSVFHMNLDGSGFEDLNSFSGGNDGQHPQATPLVSGDQVYGTTSEGGQGGDGTVFKLSLGQANGLQLAIALAGKNVVVSWPAGAATSVLQSTVSLGAATGWTNLNLTPLVSGGTNFVTYPISGAQRFFRLRQ
jgi:uncharacterized repeat protein (TIGR03803 family)